MLPRAPHWELGLPCVAQFLLPSDYRYCWSNDWARGVPLSCCFKRKQSMGTMLLVSGWQKHFWAFFLLFTSQGPLSCPAFNTVILAPFSHLSYRMFLPYIPTWVKFSAASGYGAWSTHGFSSPSCWGFSGFGFLLLVFRFSETFIYFTL